MAATIQLHHGATRLAVTTNGGAILAFSDAGVDLMRPAAADAPPIDSACYPLVPFGNRIRGNRFSFGGHDFRLSPNTQWDPHYLHGEGWRSEWTVGAETSDTLSLRHRHDGSALPYVYEAQQDFTLGDGRLTLAMTVTNRGDRVMPFGIGWHPYFPLTPETTLQARASFMWTEEEGWLPGHRQAIPEDLNFGSPRGLPYHWFNNAFEGWDGLAHISWPERGKTLRIEADPAFNAAFLFVSDTTFDPSYKRDFFAFEPMSHLPDGHNLPDLGGLVALAPGESLSGRIKLFVEDL